MPRRKPRFTVDPPPLNITGAGLFNWAYTQLQRIEDFWPKDYGDRVTALEELQNGLKGEWIVAGESSVRFEGTVSDEVYVWDCETFSGETVTYEQSYAKTTSRAFWSKANDGTIYFSDLSVGLLSIDSESMAISQIYETGSQSTTGNFHPHMLFVVGNEQYIVYAYLSGVNWLTNTYRISDQSTRETVNWGGASGFDFYFSSESQDFISGRSRSSGRFVVADKTDLSNYVIDGINDEESIWAGCVDYNSNKFQFFDRVSDTEYQLKEFTVSAGSPPTLSSISTVATVDTSLLSGDVSIYGDHPKLVLRSTYWWLPIQKDAVLEVDDLFGFLLVSSVDGSIFGSPVYINDGDTTGQTWGNLDGWGGQSDAFCLPGLVNYDESLDKFYWIRNGKICRYDPITNSFDGCCLIESTADQVNTPEYQSGGFSYDNYIWLIDPDGSSPIVETYSTVFYRLKAY